MKTIAEFLLSKSNAKIQTVNFDDIKNKENRDFLQALGDDVLAGCYTVIEIGDIEPFIVLKYYVGKESSKYYDRMIEVHIIGFSKITIKRYYNDDGLKRPMEKHDFRFDKDVEFNYAVNFVRKSILGDNVV